MDLKIPQYFYEKTIEEQEKMSLIRELLRYLSGEGSVKVCDFSKNNFERFMHPKSSIFNEL